MEKAGDTEIKEVTHQNQQILRGQSKKEIRRKQKQDKSRWYLVRE